MSDKEISGVRTDISLKEFKDGLAPETPKMKRQRFFGKVKGILDFFGITDSGGGSAAGSAGTHTHAHSASHSFRASHHVDIPQKTHEDMVREHIAHDAYMKMVDGKGDHDCGHEH